MTLVWNRGAIGESSRTQRCCRESKHTAETDFSQNSRPYIVLKNPRDLHAMLAFHWLRLSPMQCLFFISYGLHPHISCLFIGHSSPPRNSCYPLVTVYTCLPVIPLLILSTAGCICNQHPPGSSQVKMIFTLIPSPSNVPH